MKLDLLVLDWSGVVSHDFGLVHASVNEIMAHFGKPPISEHVLRTDFRPNLGDFYAAHGIPEYERVKQIHTDFFKREGNVPTAIPGA
jgi:hypothetical protein